MARSKLLAAAGIATMLCASAAFASSDGAWAEFEQKVRTSCTAVANGALTNPSVAVDPFGTESYGVAVLTGKPKGAKTAVSYLCVMDKKTGKAELGSELGADVLKVTIPAKK